MDDRSVGGRYRLLESLGIGGMASVWRALDERTGDEVVVKRLHPHLVADPTARARLSREADSLRAVRHPNVVRVRDAVIDGDEPALVLDLVRGRSVADMLADGHRFDEVETLTIAAAIAEGLAAVHRAGIVHRDIKPANVLIGEDGVARIFDFGIASGAADASALTADDGVVGTMRYLPPERLRGDVAGPAADVWGLGAVAYEMLAGAPAYPAMTLGDRVDGAGELPTRPPGSTDATWAILARALAPEPDDRFASGAALAAALTGAPGAQALSDTGRTHDTAELVAMPVVGPSPAPTGRPAIDRRLGVAAGLIVVLVAVALVAGAAGPDLAAAPASPSPSVDPTPAATVVPAEAPPADAKAGKGKGNGKDKGKD